MLCGACQRPKQLSRLFLATNATTGSSMQVMSPLVYRLAKHVIAHSVRRSGTLLHTRMKVRA